MAIPTILKGDTPAAISITAPEAVSVLTVRYQNVTRSFASVAAGDAVSLQFTADETASFRLGTFPVYVHATTAAGSVKSYPIKAKIKVTDCPGEVYEADLSISGATPVNQTSVSEVAEGSTMKDIREKVNQLARIISGTASVFMACVALGAAKLEDIPGTNTVYTASETDAAIATATNSLGEAKQDKLAKNQDLPDYYDIYAIHTYSAETDDYGNNIATTYATVDSLGSIESTVKTWQTYWDGDNVRVTITNYYGSTARPSLYIEQKVSDGGTNYFKTVWDERTRWNDFLPSYADFTNNAAQNYADRAWGIYDSSTGAYSPDGLLQLSQEQIMIASGMAWQKTLTTGGCAVWVLKATDPTTFSGVSSNGFFRIEDGDGNALFEIVKGDKRTVGATGTDPTFDGGTMTITYNSVSDEHPALQVCDDLAAADWKAEDDGTLATVSWGGTSGAWIATVTPVGTRTQLFAKATYEAGGNTYIKNCVAHSADKVVIGGVEYTVTVETVNGKKLMVLQ